MGLNFFKTALKIHFQSTSEDESSPFMQEYLSLNLAHLNDRWKKLGLKVDFTEGEALLFDLILSLKQDVKNLEQKLFEKEALLRLEHEANLCGINFEHIQIKENLFVKNQIYYARFELNHTKIALFIRALSANEAEIYKIKKEDKQYYDAFVTQMQRDMIKSLKGYKDE